MKKKTYFCSADKYKHLTVFATNFALNTTPKRLD